MRVASQLEDAQKALARKEVELKQREEKIEKLEADVWALTSANQEVTKAVRLSF
jgi:septal ring factor EnvC (AmiA/AmiB activator)